MKQILFVVSLLVLIGLTNGCNSSNTGSTQELVLSSVPWKDGDELTYDILDKNGNKVGTSEFSFALEGDNWALSLADKAANLDQSAKILVDMKTLKPIGEEKSIKVPNVDATVSTTYKDGKLQINAVQNGENKSATIDVPANAIDNDQLLMSLRGLPYTDGYQASFVTVVPASAAKINSTLKVIGKEKVDVPAGSFDTWKVDLDFSGTKQQVWYQVDGPNNMVQYDNGTTRLVLQGKP